jgi:hypothetical protein
VELSVDIEDSWNSPGTELLTPPAKKGSSNLFDGHILLAGKVLKFPIDMVGVSKVQTN